MKKKVLQNNRFTLTLRKGLRFLLIFTLALAGSESWGQTNIVDFSFYSLPGGINNFGPSPFAPSATNANVTAVGLTRDIGLSSTGTGGANAWGASTGTIVASQAAAISGNSFVTFSITPNTGYIMSLSQIPAYNIRHSTTGNPTGIWQYSTNGTTFNNIGTAITWGAVTTAAGNPQTAISLSGIPALQNVPAGTIVTFRVVIWGATNVAGTWYFNEPTSGASDLIVQGTVLSTTSLCPATSSISPITAQSICEGVTANTLTATVSTTGSLGTPTYRYQWYYNTTNSNTITVATLLTNDTLSTYTPLSTSNEIGTRYYFCVGYSTDNSCGQTNATQSLASSPVSVTVTATPATPTANSNGPVCAGDSLLVNSSSVSGATYSWSGPNLFSSSSQNQKVSANATLAMAGTYSVTVTVNGCASIAGTTSVVVNILPSVSSIVSSTSVCTGFSETLTGTGALSYNWSGGISDGISFIPGSTATYTVTGTDGNGCKNTATQTITVNPLPTVGINASATTVCAGTSVTLNGTGATTYVWSGGVFDGTSFLPGSTGTYLVTGTDINSCVNTATQTITVNNIPATPTLISGNTAVCPNANQTYSISSVTGAISYTWTLPSGWSGTSDSTHIITLTGTNSGNILVTADNTCGNSTPQNLSIAVGSTPATPAAIIGNTVVCSGTPQTFYLVAVANATSYSWTLPVTWSGTSSIDSISPVIGTSGGTISVIANGTCGNSSAQTLAITFGNAPSQPSSILGVTHLCDSSSTAYAVTNDPAATSYTWTLPNGWTGTSTNSIITATASAFSGVITVTANNGCGASTPQTINVFGSSIPIVTLSPFGTVCQSAGASVLSGGSPTGGIYSGTGVNSNTFNPSIAGLGTYMITYTYTQGACVRIDSAAITVDLCTGIVSNTNPQDISIYPNPATDRLNITLGNQQQLLVEIYDIIGNIVLKSFIHNTESFINIEQFDKGMYLVRLMDEGNNILYTQRLIKQ